MVSNSNSSVENFLKPYFASFLLFLGSLVFGYLAYALLIVVEEGKIYIVERFGKFHRTLRPGINFKIPFIDNVKSWTWEWLEENKTNGSSVLVKKRHTHLDMAQQILDIPSLKAVSLDDITFTLDLCVFYTIEDCRAALYNVKCLPETIRQYVVSQCRTLASSLTFDSIYRNRNVMIADLNRFFADLRNRLGTNISIVVQEIKAPSSFAGASESFTIKKIELENMKKCEDKRLEAELAKIEANYKIDQKMMESKKLIAKYEGEAAVAYWEPIQKQGISSQVLNARHITAMESMAKKCKIFVMDSTRFGMPPLPLPMPMPMAECKREEDSAKSNIDKTN